jgi:DNA mismatch repair protein MutS
VNGIVTQSYGVAVARLAGLPASVTARAQLLLEQQQQDSAVASPKPIVTSHQISPSVNSAADQLMTDLKRLHIDDLTPRGALEELYRLRKMVNTPL